MTLVIMVMSAFNERLMNVLVVFPLSVCGNVWFSTESAPFEKCISA